MDTAKTTPSSTTELDRIPEYVEQLFRERGETFTPQVKSNLLETWQAYWLQIALPGIDPTTLKIQAAGRRVQLSARFKAHVIETASYLRQGLPAGEIFETFDLPDDVEGECAEAGLEGGILTVHLPKVSYRTPASIPVRCQ